MNQLSNFIDIIPLSDVVSINGNDVVLVDGKTFDRINSETSPEWSEPPSVSKAGTSYAQSLRLVPEKLSDTLKKRYPVNHKVLVRMYDDAGSYLLGSFDQPARATIVPNPHTDQLQISRQATTPIY